MTDLQLTPAQDVLLAKLIEAKENPLQSVMPDFEYSPAYIRCKGTLPRDQWEKIINEGQSVLFKDKTIQKIEDIPLNLDHDLVFHPSLPKEGLIVAQENIDALIHHKLIQFRDKTCFFITSEGSQIHKNKGRNETVANWRPWGDHPYFVSASLIMGFLGLILAFMQTCGTANRVGNNNDADLKPRNNQPLKETVSTRDNVNNTSNDRSKFLYKPQKPLTLVVSNAGKNNKLEINLIEIASEYAESGDLMIKVSLCNMNSSDFVGSKFGSGGARVFVDADKDKKVKEAKKRFDQEVKKDYELHHLSLWYTDQLKQLSIKWEGLIYDRISPNQCVSKNFLEAQESRGKTQEKVKLLQDINGTFYARLGEGETTKTQALTKE